MITGTGLHIDKHGIELVQIARQFGSLKVIGASYIPVAASGGDDQTNRETLVKSIQQLFRQSGVHPGAVVTALPVDEAMVRYFEMPAVPKKDWATAIRFEGKKYIPFRLDDIVSSYYVQPIAPKSNTMKVIFVVAKQQSLGGYLGMLQAANVKVASVEAIPFSLWRLYRLLEKPSKDQAAVVVYVGPESACVNVMHRYGLQLTRDVALGRLGVAVAEVAAGASHDATASGVGIGAGESLGDLLLSEIRLTMDYYRKRFSAEQIGRIVLCGLEECEGCIEMLGKELGLPVRFWKLDRDLGLKGRSVGSLVLAAGFALRGTMSGTAWIDLVERKALSKPVVADKIRHTLTREAVVACAILIVWVFWLQHQQRQLQAELISVSAQRLAVPLPHGTPMTVPDLTSLAGQFEQRSQSFERMIGQYLPLTHRLGYLGEVLPEGVWLTGLVYDERSGRDVQRVARICTLNGLVFLQDSQDEIRAINRLISNLRGHVQFFNGLNQANLVTVQRKSVNDCDVTHFEVRLSGGEG